MTEILTFYKGNGSTATAFARALPIESGFINKPSSRFEQSDGSSFETESWMEESVEESSALRLSSTSQRLLTHNRYGLHSATPVYLTLSPDVENHYWCTVCENPKSYKDSDNWKKHEKGHETLFVCELDDGVEDSRAGQTSPTKPFSCKRRDIMVNHLTKSHGIFTVEQGRELADKWRISVRKQAWSCGFCGSLFLNLQDRLKHIDTEHFRKYENIRDWDFCKVIHGLLRHPNMESAWKKRTASLLPWVQPEDLVWTEAFAKNMRTRLEIGPSDEGDANRLADEVYFAGRAKESWQGNATAPTTFMGAGMAGAPSLSAPKLDQPFTDQASGSGPEHRQSSSTMRATAYVSGDPFVGRPLGHAYDRDSRAVPPMVFSDEGGPKDYDVSSFYPSQSWAVASETSNDHCGYGQAATEANQRLRRSTSDWNGP